MSIANIPVVRIEVKLPAGEPWSWDDETLISFIDAYQAQMDGHSLNTVFSVDEQFVLFMKAWSELTERTEVVA